MRVRPPWGEPAPSGLDLVIEPGRRSARARTTRRGCAWSSCSTSSRAAPFADWGSGSGVLAVAAARLGYAPVLACDVDPLSVAATARAAAANGVPGVEAVRADLRREPGPWAPTVCANLVGPLLLDVAAAARAAARAPHRLRAAARGGRRGGGGLRGPRPARGRPAQRGRVVGAPALRVASAAMARNVLILGGGFGGLTVARRLERKLPPLSAQVTLVNDVNFMLYTPLLPGAAGGTLEPRHVVVPLREQLRRTELHLGAGARRGPGAQASCRVRSIGGHEDELPYDQLVVALGLRSSRTLPIPGLAEHALGFKTLPEAIALRNRLLHRSSRRRWRRTRPSGGPCSPTCSSARATPAWRASPSCRTSRRT